MSDDADGDTAPNHRTIKNLNQNEYRHGCTDTILQLCLFVLF